MRYRKPLIKKILYAILLILIFILAINYYENISQYIENTKQDTSTWIKSFEQDPERYDECKETFEYINELRLSYNKDKISWSEELYELAVFRSKDMYEKNYFDHVTPEGLCVKDYKKEFSIEQSAIIAENCGGMTHYESGYPIKSTTVNEAVDGWMTSRGHRYNLMYSEHTEGAIGCYMSNCVFLGLHYNPYGLGSGPCTTGEEGEKFWIEVPEQEGEV